MHWSDCPYSQADLSLCWWNILDCWKSCHSSFTLVIQFEMPIKFMTRTNLILRHVCWAWKKKFDNLGAWFSRIKSLWSLISLVCRQYERKSGMQDYQAHFSTVKRTPRIWKNFTGKCGRSAKLATLRITSPNYETDFSDISQNWDDNMQDVKTNCPETVCC